MNSIRALIEEDPQNAKDAITKLSNLMRYTLTVSYTHLRAHETVLDLVCRLLLEKKKYK